MGEEVPARAEKGSPQRDALISTNNWNKKIIISQAFGNNTCPAQKKEKPERRTVQNGSEDIYQTFLKTQGLFITLRLHYNTPLVWLTRCYESISHPNF